jgi:hypothetical protein
MRTAIFILVGAFVAGFGFGLPDVQAAEPVCKGFASEACTGNSDCSWVKPHKIKSGKEVAGFCRKKAVRQSKTPKSQAKSS